MITDIYYFSGTGNSLYIARELHNRIPDSRLIPIAALLNRRSKKTNKNIKATAKTNGIVFPCHGLTIPIPVKKFLRYLDLTSSEYLFAIATRGGTIFHGFEAIDKILHNQGTRLDASFIINMAMNDPKLKSFTIPSTKELYTLEKIIQTKLNLIQDTVINHKSYHDNINGVTFSRFNSLNYILERIVPFAVHHISPKVKKYFYTDSKCTGCGICEKVCLSEKIKIVNDRPIWQKNKTCYMCYACLNYCPTQSIQIYSKFYMKSFTEEKERYSHPYALVKDIVIQKLDPTTH